MGLKNFKISDIIWLQVESDFKYWFFYKQGIIILHSQISDILKRAIHNLFRKNSALQDSRCGMPYQ